MTIIISNPTEIESKVLQGIINLISAGGQVEREGLKERILRADLIAYKLQGDKIISTATLKNPDPSYRRRVFEAVKATLNVMKYEKELGYIATHSEYEGKGHCTALLKAFFPTISNHSIFATTRKPAMIQILQKFGFKQVGEIYEGDLKLMIYDEDL